MEIIYRETNSYAYRAKVLWKGLTVIELYHFFGMLLTIGLWNHPIRSYLWDKERGPLSGLPISKNRFEDILRYLYFKDRGPAPQSGRPW